MHETEKQKANLISNHNFLEKFDFIVQVQWLKLKATLGALKRSFREKTSSARLKS